MEENIIQEIARRVAEIILRDITPVYDKPLYTIKEAAAFLGVKRSYLYQLIRENKIPYYRSKGGKLIYLRRNDLTKWSLAVRVSKKENQSHAHD